MATNTLATKTDGNIISSDDVNQYKTALGGNFVPRNATGAATDEGGSLGTDAIKWLKAHIAAGYWDVGDIKPHHSFNNTITVSQGWFPCDGSIINETNYDAIHGAGSWSTYVSSSALDGKYSPNLTDKYLIGKATTTQDGTVAITSVGNSGSTINIQHDHTVNSHSHSTPAHNHQWYDYTDATSGDFFYDNLGAAKTSSGATSNVAHIEYQSVATNTMGDDLYTDVSGAGTTGAASPSTTTSLSTAQDIRPESIEMEYYIRII